VTPRISVALAISIAVLFVSLPQDAQAQSASVSVDASVLQPEPVPAGTAFDYVIHVNNEGPDDAASPSLTFTIAPGVLFQSVTPPAGWSCNAIPAGTDGPTLTCTAATLSPGTATFTVTASTSPSAMGMFTSTATVSSTTPDPSDNDNTADVLLLVQTASDYSVTLAGAPPSVNAGANVTWTAVITNNGPSTGSAASLSIPLPDTTFVSVAAPAGWTCTTPAVGSNGTVDCSLSGTMNVNTTATFVVVSRVPSSTPAGTTITTTATVSSPDDTVNANNTASASVQTTESADLGITKTLPASPAIRGGPLHYTITVTNFGPGDAAAATMTDILPAPLRFTAVGAPAGWSCTTPPAGANGTISCSNPSMVSGTTATFTLDVVIDPATAAGTTITNTAHIATTTPDANASNDSASATAVVATPVDITASKSAGGPAHPAGSTVTYTIVLSNSGSLAQTDNPGNELTDVLPSSLTLVSASATSGTAAANIGTNTVTWNGSIAGGGTVTVTIQALVNSGTTGMTISNSATVSFDSDASGTNDTTRTSDDPATSAPSDPTSFLVAGSVPAISPRMLLLLGMMLAAMALFAARK
jgi:uncharacterized repeat protein (TIGR01451 family)